MRKLGLWVLGAVLGAASASAGAQFKDAEAAIDYRSSVMVLMGSHFGRMGPMAKKEAPFDPEMVKRNVALLNTFADLPWVAYGPGTEGGEAKDEIWKDPEGFKQAQDQFKGTLAKLTAAAEGGDFDTFRVAFGGVGKSCKSCHDSFRNKD